MEFEGKKVLVIGTGLSGMGAAQMLSMLGARVTILDNNAKAEVEKIRAGFERILKKEEIDKLNIMVGPSSEEKAVSENMTDGKPGFDLVVPSPGVPLDSPLVMKMKDAGIPVISEIELGYLNEKGRVIAITGTNGKTTTTTLVGDIMKAYAEQWKAGSLDQNRFPACSRAIVVGNIGQSYAAASMDTASDTVTVGEISSFQLEAIDTFHPVVSAILNITPDHLNRHYTMQNYSAIKERIAKNQSSQQTCQPDCLHSIFAHRYTPCLLIERAQIKPCLSIPHAIKVRKQILTCFKDRVTLDRLPGGQAIARRKP